MGLDRRELVGPFDVIGDVHGCGDELGELLDLLGYTTVAGVRRHPHGRRAIFAGDVVNRGPRNLATVDMVAPMLRAGSALAVRGNHDQKMLERLSDEGRDPWTELSALPDGERRGRRRQIRSFLAALDPYLILDGGRLVVAHAGLPEAMHGLDTPAVRRFAQIGRPLGGRHPNGRPLRWDWAQEYAGAALVVYGHTPVAEPRWVNNTVNVDTGCVYGGALTALRYPEGECVTVHSHAAHHQPKRPTGPVV
jgi:protein phosphatase